MNTIDTTRYTVLVVELDDDDYGQPCAVQKVWGDYATLAEAEAQEAVANKSCWTLNTAIKLPNYYKMGYDYGMRSYHAQPDTLPRPIMENNEFWYGFNTGWDVAENSPVTFVKMDRPLSAVEGGRS